MFSSPYVLNRIDVSFWKVDSSNFQSFVELENACIREPICKSRRFSWFFLECLLIRVTGDYASESQSVKVFGFPVVFYLECLEIRVTRD